MEGLCFKLSFLF